MNRTAFFIFVFFLLILLGFRFSSYYQNQIQYQDGQTVTFVARLSTIPEEKGRSQNFSLTLPDGPKLYITTSRFPEYRYGDIINVSGTIEEREIGNTEKRIILTMSYPKIALQPEKNSAYRLLITLRERVTELYQHTLPPHSASLLSGIVFGIKEHMDEEFESDLRESGVMHVIAASGMNVAMVAGAVFGIFSHIISRRKAILVALVSIMLYAILSGLEASIVRATIMAGFALVAGLLGRQYFGFLALMLTAYVMLIFNPSYITDVGFQLSFAATLGIMYIKPPESFLVKEKGIQSTKSHLPLLDDVQVTIAAQVATLPILLSVFGEYGLLSIVVNALVLWTIPILMVIGASGAIVGMVIPFIGKLILLFAFPFLWYFEMIVGYFGSLGYVFQIGELPLVFVVAYYAIVLAIMLSRKRSAK